MLTIKKKVILIIICPLLCLSLTTTFFTLYPATKELKKTANNELIDMSLHVSLEIEGLLRKIEAVVSVLSYSVELQFDMASYSKYSDEYLTEYRNSIAPLVEKVAEETNNNQGVYFIFAPGIGTKFSQVWYNLDKSTGNYKRMLEFPDPNIFYTQNSSLDFYNNTLDKGIGLWSDPYIDINIKKSLVSYTRPVIVDGITIGVVGLDISIDLIQEDLSKIKYLDSGYAFLLDSKANIIYHPQLTIGTDLDDVFTKDLSYLIEGFKSDKNNNSFLYTYNGEQKRLGYTKLNNKWIIAIAVIDKDIFKNVSKIQKILITMNILILFITLVFTLIYTKSVTRPLEIFTSEIKKSVNNYNYVISDPKLLERDDEIGTMSQAFLDLQNANKKIINIVITNNISLERMALLGKQVAAFTHELKTPLSVIITATTYFTDSIKDLKHRFETNSLPKSELENYISSSEECGLIIQRNNQIMNKMTNNFKTVAVNGSNIEWSNVNLQQLVSQIFDNFSIGNNGIKIIFNLKIAKDLQIFTCSGYLGQVFTNLIQNSINHGFYKKDNGEINIVIDNSNGKTYINYYDDGNGIPKDKAEEVFKPYFSSAKDRGGTGLGLHIIQTIIISHLGGTITLLNSAKPGVHFKIVLPIKDPDKIV